MTAPARDRVLTDTEVEYIKRLVDDRDNQVTFGDDVGGVLSDDSDVE